jgi:hypothetical protein
MTDVPGKLVPCSSMEVRRAKQATFELPEFWKFRTGIGPMTMTSVPLFQECPTSNYPIRYTQMTNYSTYSTIVSKGHGF